MHEGQAGGALEVICGPMFSGKTEELIRRVKRAEIAKKRVQVFKPRLDARYSAEHIASHNGMRARAVVVESAAELAGLLDELADVVAIDEVQFFDPGIVDVCEALAASGRRVIAAGLDLDFRGASF